MTEERKRPAPRAVVLDAALACGWAALGIGCLVAGKVALGVLSLILLAGLVGGEIILRRGSDAAVLRFAVARPFLFGGWLVGIAGVIIVSHGSLDWIVVLPLGVAYIGLGVWLSAVSRRRR